MEHTETHWKLDLSWGSEFVNLLLEHLAYSSSQAWIPCGIIPLFVSYLTLIHIRDLSFIAFFFLHALYILLIEIKLSKRDQRQKKSNFKSANKHGISFWKVLCVLF